MTRQIKNVLAISTHLRSDVKPPYQHYVFQVPAGATRVSLRIRCLAHALTQLPIALYDPQQCRGVLVNEPTTGEICVNLRQ